MGCPGNVVLGRSPRECTGRIDRSWSGACFFIQLMDSHILSIILKLRKRCRGTEYQMAGFIKKPVKLICATCRKEFKGTKQHKFCSPECRRLGRCRRDHHHVETKNKQILHLMWQFTCYLCGKTAAWDGVDLDLDHIVPHSCGGEDLAGNLITCCARCNRSRQDKRFHPAVEESLLRIARERCVAFGIDPFHGVRIVR